MSFMEEKYQPKFYIFNLYLFGANSKMDGFIFLITPSFRAEGKKCHTYRTLAQINKAIGLMPCMCS